MKRIRCRGEEETLALGRLLGELAFPGCVIALEGALGAGKTLLARGVGQGLGVEEPVTSPTFLLVVPHEGGRLPMVHADLYRLQGPGDLEEIGLLDAMEEGCVTVVEWADRFPGLLPADRLRVLLDFVPSNPLERDVAVVATGPAHLPLEAAVGG